jgi:hypothetical protein
LLIVLRSGLLQRLHGGLRLGDVFLGLIAVALRGILCRGGHGFDFLATLREGGLLPGGGGVALFERLAGFFEFLPLFLDGAALVFDFEGGGFGAGFSLILQGACFYQGVLAGGELGDSGFKIVASGFDARGFFDEAGEGFLGSGYLSGKITAALFEITDFVEASLGLLNLRLELLFFEARGLGAGDGFLGRGLGGDKLALPIVFVFLEAFKFGETGGDARRLRFQAFVVLIHFGVEFLHVGAIAGEGLAFGRDFLAFEGEVLLAFEELDAIAAEQLHLLGELVFPGGHLLQLGFEHHGRIEHRILSAARVPLAPAPPGPLAPCARPPRHWAIVDRDQIRVRSSASGVLLSPAPCFIPGHISHNRRLSARHPMAAKCLPDKPTWPATVSPAARRIAFRPEKAGCRAKTHRTILVSANW